MSSYLKGYTIFSSGAYFIQLRDTICAISVEGNTENDPAILF